jgi:periplasmic copper chaperone A
MADRHGRAPPIPKEKRSIAMSRLHVALLAAALVSASAVAHEYQLKTLAIDHPFTRATPPGGSVAGAFMAIANQGKDADRLVGVTSPAAAVVQIHEMSMDGAVMRMRLVQGIDLKAGATVQLKPGGFHVMLEGLKQPLKLGDEIPLTLRFEKAGSIDVMVQVEGMGATAHAH